jgi:signal transduction histidine kinase
VSRRADFDESPLKTERAPQKSIKRRVIRLVLVPGAVAVVLWLVASGYLVFTGFYAREVANGVRQVSIPAVTGLASIQRERRLSIAALAEPGSGRQQLVDQRKQTDQQVSAMRAAAEDALARAPQSIKSRWSTLSANLDRLPALRAAIDSGAATHQRVYDSYNGLLDSAIDLFDTQARVVPDVTATQGGIAATEIFRSSDLMSRASSIIVGAFSSGTLNRDDYLKFVSLVGAYHADLANVAPHLQPEVRQQFGTATAGDAWKQLVAAENSIIAAGPWQGRVPRGLAANAGEWDAFTTAVSDKLIGLTIAQADQVSAQALRTGNNQLLVALLGSLIALAIAVGAIIWAVRQSQVLVDRALSVRLAQLGSDAVAVVDQRLPEMMQRLRRREKVDTAVELSQRDYGRDEIGQLAEVLNRSLHAAVAAAVDEAKTRAAGMAMLMGVARRPQRPLQRGLQVVEDLQNRIGDEKLLAELFDVNHQLTQTRRFLENLMILAGGQTGRRFHNPVPIRRILLGAIAETQQYRRITLRRAPEISLAGTAVAGITHLLAELLDNALAFSPPETEVFISCSQAKRGVVIEIEDAGVGMVDEDLDRANELLATAPTPDVTSIKDGAQIGFWVVAELARRIGIRVTLRTSAYGGILAVVLLPERVVASGTDEPTMALSMMASEPDLLEAAPTLNGELVRRPAAAVLTAADTAGDEAGPERDAGGDVVRPIQTTVRPDTVRPDTLANAPLPNTPVRSAPKPSAPLPSAAAPSAGTPRPATPDRPPLPVRRPQEHLAPELRDDVSPGGYAAAEPPRSPEQARARFARYQQGRQAGRGTTTDEPSDEIPAGTNEDRKA